MTNTGTNRGFAGKQFDRRHAGSASIMR